MKRNITKREMARILSRYKICYLYGKDVDKICRQYNWEELHDMYIELDEALADYYGN